MSNFVLPPKISSRNFTPFILHRDILDYVTKSYNNYSQNYELLQKYIEFLERFMGGVIAADEKERCSLP
jgi:hypothetical protein